MIDSVSLDDAGPIVRDLVAAIVRDAARLSELDGAIGDGDHGINMSRGFRLADTRLGAAAPDLAQGLGILGDTLLNEIGGSMGPIYGTFFGEMGQRLGDAGRIDRSSFASALRAATDAMQELGGAAPGDKMLIDVLVPALAAYDNAARRDDSFAACLNAMSVAAGDGLEATRDMVAKVGRAARLGERSRGTLDPGAASCRLLLATLADYGDLAGKVVAGADWMLADAVGEEPIDPQPLALVQDHIKGWLRGFDRIRSRDTEALRGLVSGLLIAGFAMQAHGNSRPASGSDHQIAHVWEMERLTVNGEPAAHGACVGIGTVAMLALYEWFLAQDVPALVARRAQVADDDGRAIEAELQASFVEPSLVASARAEMAAKREHIGRRPLRLRTLGAAWQALRDKITTTLVPAATMEQWLSGCDAASHPADLGVSLDKLAKDYRRARLIRRRYTPLDCLEDLGCLDTGIQALFTNEGFWGRRRR